MVLNNMFNVWKVNFLSLSSHILKLQYHLVEALRGMEFSEGEFLNNAEFAVYNMGKETHIDLKKQRKN